MTFRSCSMASVLGAHKYDHEQLAGGTSRDSLAILDFVPDRVLEVADGRSVQLGTDDQLREAMTDIFKATGGSSGRGRYSYLFGLDGGNVLSAEQADQLAEEAAEFRSVVGPALRGATMQLLDRLSELRGEIPQGG